MKQQQAGPGVQQVPQPDMDQFYLALYRAEQKWRRWERARAWFWKRPYWQRLLLGGLVTAMLLHMLEGMAEDLFWKIEMEYH